jgi:hypothetical protein
MLFAGVIAAWTVAFVIALYMLVSRWWGFVVGYVCAASAPLAAFGIAILSAHALGFLVIVPVLASAWASLTSVALGVVLFVRSGRRHVAARDRRVLVAAMCVSSIPALLVLGDFARAAGRGPTTAFFGAMQIDPVSLEVRLSDTLTMDQALDTPHFFRFRSQSFDSIDHYAGWRQAPQRTRYNAFAVSYDGRLLYRNKYQELLRGPFGTVYAESTYYYSEQYKGQTPEFTTVAYANSMEHEPPEIGEALPPDEALNLSAVSVVRIFRAPPELLIVSANYDAHGAIQSIHVNGAKGGDWVHSNEVPDPYRGLGVATMFGDRPAARAYYGLPGAFPVEAYRRDPTDVFGHSALESDLDVVHLHFNRNQWVQQDVFRPQELIKRRILRFQVTEQDLVLDSWDEQGAFGVVNWLKQPRLPNTSIQPTRKEDARG